LSHGKVFGDPRGFGGGNGNSSTIGDCTNESVIMVKPETASKEKKKQRMKKETLKQSPVTLLAGVTLNQQNPK
jgi:hypothetical protein